MTAQETSADLKKLLAENPACGCGLRTCPKCAGAASLIEAIGALADLPCVDCSGATSCCEECSKTFCRHCDDGSATARDSAGDVLTSWCSACAKGGR